MPKKIYNRKKRVVNKPYRKTAKITKNFTNSLTRSIGFPRCYHTTLRYAETIVFNGSAPLTQQFRLNSIFDPNFTGTGHSPMYKSQLEAIYNEYLVKNCTVTLLFSQTNDNDYPCVITVDVRNDSITRSGTNIGQRIEDGQSSVLQLGYAGSGSAVKTFSRKVDIAKQWGIRRTLSPQDYDWTASMTANPTNEVFATIQGMAINAGSNNISFMCQVVIDYYVCCFSKTEIAQS